MNLLEELKNRKEENKERLISESFKFTVDTLLEHYEDIQKAITLNYRFFDIIDVLFKDKTTEYLPEAFYVIEKTHEKLGKNIAYKKECLVADEGKPAPKPCNDFNILPSQPSNKAFNRYMQNKDVVGYAVFIRKANDDKNVYVFWVVAQSLENARTTAFITLKKKDLNKGIKTSYSTVKVEPMTYNDYLTDYGYWEED